MNTRDHIYIDKKLSSGDSYRGSQKYDGRLFPNFTALIKEFNDKLFIKLKSLPNDNPNLDISKVRENLLACGLSIDCDNNYLLHLSEILSAGIPPVFVNVDFPCDFILFDRKGYQYTCIRRDVQLKDLNKDNIASCLRTDPNKKWVFEEKKKPCDSINPPDKFLSVLFAFHQMFPKLQVGKPEEEKGKLPVFFFSYFLGVFVF